MIIFVWVGYNNYIPKPRPFSRTLMEAPQYQNSPSAAVAEPEPYSAFRPLNDNYRPEPVVAQQMTPEQLAAAYPNTHLPKTVQFALERQNSDESETYQSRRVADRIQAYQSQTLPRKIKINRPPPSQEVFGQPKSYDDPGEWRSLLFCK